MGSEMRVGFKVIGRDLVQYARHNHRFKNKTGKLERDIKYEVRGSGKDLLLLVGLSDNHPYGHFVHSGRRPDFITPTNKKALRWVGKGGFGFSKGHYVKGTKPDPFITNAVEKNTRLIENEIEKTMQRAIDKQGLGK